MRESSKSSDGEEALIALVLASNQTTAENVAVTHAHATRTGSYTSLLLPLVLS